MILQTLENNGNRMVKDKENKETVEFNLFRCVVIVVWNFCIIIMMEHQIFEVN